MKSIPEIFYDLIGRIGPGALLIFTTFVAWLGPAQARWEIHDFFQKAKNKEELFYCGLISFLAYLVGVALSALWDWLAEPQRFQKLLRSSLAAVEQKWQNWRLTEKLLAGKASEWRPDTGLLVRYVNVHLPAEGFLLVKIKAEENFCKTMITGMILILGLATVAPGCALFRNDDLSASVLTAGAMVLSAVACWLWKGYLSERYEADLRSLVYLAAVRQPPVAAQPKLLPKRVGGAYPAARGSRHPLGRMINLSRTEVAMYTEDFEKWNEWHESVDPTLLDEERQGHGTYCLPEDENLAFCPECGALAESLVLLEHRAWCSLRDSESTEL